MVQTLLNETTNQVLFYVTMNSMWYMAVLLIVTFQFDFMLITYRLRIFCNVRFHTGNLVDLLVRTTSCFII